MGLPLLSTGARALGVEGTRIEAGAPADPVALDLSGHQLARVPAEHLPAAALLAGSAVLVRATWVAGRRPFDALVVGGGIGGITAADLGSPATA